MKRIARFEKVSKEQYKKDFCKKDLGVLPYVVNKDDPALSINQCYDRLETPVRKTKGSAGYDFITPCDLVILPHSEALIHTGFKCKIEEGYVLKMYPRSSLGYGYRLSLANTVGIIDSDFYNNIKNEGHISCKLYNPSDKTLTIKAGEAYAQGIFEEFFITVDDNASAVRVGGIGSTNNQN